MKELKRIRKKTIDKDECIIVTIEKYGIIGCCFHSFYGFLALALIVGTIALFFLGRTTLAIIAMVISLFLWVEAWLNANDRLKKRIYTKMLLESIKSKVSEEQVPTIVKFYPRLDYIDCLQGDGTIKRYDVEVVMQKFPLYVVKIHTKSREE